MAAFTGKRWKSNGAIFLNQGPNAGHYPRVGTIIEIVPINPRPTPPTDIVSWDEDSNGAYVRSVASIGKTMHLYQLRFTQPPLTKTIPVLPHDPPQVDFDKTFLKVLEGAVYMDLGGFLVTAPVPVGGGVTMTFIIQFKEDGSMYQSAYSSNGYIGCYPCTLI